MIYFPVKVLCFVCYFIFLSLLNSFHFKIFIAYCIYLTRSTCHYSVCVSKLLPQKSVISCGRSPFSVFKNHSFVQKRENEWFLKIQSELFPQEISDFLRKKFWNANRKHAITFYLFIMNYSNVHYFKLSIVFFNIYCFSHLEASLFFHNH